MKEKGPSFLSEEGKNLYFFHSRAEGRHKQTPIDHRLCTLPDPIVASPAEPKEKNE